MSDADGDGITVSEDGITVRKSINTEQFKTPAVVFDVRSTRGEAAPVQISEDVPPSIPPEDVGFHPAYGGDNWSISGDRVTFERSFEPDEEYTTVYGVRDVDDAALDDLLTVTPTVSVPDGEDGGGPDEEGIDELVAGGNDLVRDVIKGERDSLPGVDEDAGADAEETAPDPSFGMDEAEEPGDSPIGSSADTGTTDFDDLAAEVEAEEAAADDDEPELDSPPKSDAGDAEADSDPFGDVSVTESSSEDDSDPLADIGSPTLDEEADTTESDAGASEAADVVDDAFDRPGVVTDEAIEEAASASESASDPTVTDEPSDPIDTAVGGNESSESEDSPFEDTTDVGDDADGQITVPASGGAARVLAKELREGNVSAEDRRLLRDQLAVEEGGSIAARIEHLQTRTSDLEAYTDALEEFLDHHGDPDEAFEDVYDEVEAVSTRTEEVAETVESLEETIESLDAAVENVTGDVDRVADDVETLTADLSDTDDRLQSTIDSVERLDDRLASVAGNVETIEEQVSALESDLEHDVADLQESVAELEGLEDRLEGLERSVEDVQGVESEIATLRNRVESVEQVAAEVESLREEVDEMAAFRDQLSSAFGGGTDPE